MVSGSGVCAKRIVVDACHHMLSRLSSIIAKEPASPWSPSVSKLSGRASNQMGARLSVSSP
jgi:hypothetical protein